MIKKKKKMGLTLADFISRGTVPVVMDILISNVIGILRNSAPSFMNLAGKPSSPELLLKYFYEDFLNVLKILFLW